VTRKGWLPMSEHRTVDAASVGRVPEPCDCDRERAAGLYRSDRRGYQLVLAPDKPCWVAVNRKGAELLADLAERGEAASNAWARDLARRNGLSRAEAGQIVKGYAAETAPVWDAAQDGAYEGRGFYLRPTHLRELWLHINNRCNCACRHCLVSSGPHRDDGLPTDTVTGLIEDARDLGVVTFFFTGGEPMLRPDLPDLLRLVLEDRDAHAVVLTNGSLINAHFLEAVADLDRERLHLQVSLDGSTPRLNDALRAPRAFEHTTAGICRAVDAGIDTTVATVAVNANLHDLPAMARLLPQLGVCSWHLMWQHVRERGASEAVAPVEQLTRAVLELKQIAAESGVRIDNFETFKAIINGEPATKRDGTNACWDSLAIYADGGVYPSAAFVGIDDLRAGSVFEQPLREIWLKSPVLEECRRRTAVSSRRADEDPFLLLHGGGDPEHAYFFGDRDAAAQDPYLPLYRAMMLDAADEVVAERIALMGAREDVPVVYHVMGQDGLGCPVDAGVENTGRHRIDFIHSNCVLMQDVVGHTRQIVRDFYGEATVNTKCDVCCPVPADEGALDHIPDVNLERSYGCGSPVFAADVAEGETVVDLGSGGGIECFAAAKMVAASGRVIGIDMTPEMLALANGARPQVAANLGYDNVRFVDGYLESLPLRDDLADVVISNCVINLSPQKLKVFGEVLRVLKPGGRMVISDITAGADVPDHIKFNPRLKGECVGGALRRDELLHLLTKLGFADVRTIGELPWREVDGVEFFADTVAATKPRPGHRPLPYVGIRRAGANACECGPSTEVPSAGGTVCCAPPECAPSAGDTEACDETTSGGSCCAGSDSDAPPGRV